MMTNSDAKSIAHTLNANAADLSLVQDMADTLEECIAHFNRRDFLEAASKTRIKIIDTEVRMLQNDLRRLP